MTVRAAGPDRIQGFLTAWVITIGAPTFASMVACSDGKIRVVRAFASQAGTGSVPTIIDLWKNGNSMFRNAANRPTLAATATGPFTVGAPEEQNYKAGDVLQIRLIQSAGHGQITFTAALEEP